MCDTIDLAFVWFSHSLNRIALRTLGAEILLGPIAMLHGHMRLQVTLQLELGRTQRTTIALHFAVARHLLVLVVADQMLHLVFGQIVARRKLTRALSVSAFENRSDQVLAPVGLQSGGAIEDPATFDARFGDDVRFGQMFAHVNAHRVFGLEDLGLGNIYEDYL